MKKNSLIQLKILISLIGLEENLKAQNAAIIKQLLYLATEDKDEVYNFRYTVLSHLNYLFSGFQLLQEWYILNFSRHLTLQ